MNSMNTATTYFSLKPFELLTPFELYAIIQLRNEVFVVEQNCVYQDIDGSKIYTNTFRANAY